MFVYVLDLMVQFLYQGNVEDKWCFFFNFVFFGYCFEDWYFCIYVVNKFFGNWFIDCYQIFFFMIIVSMQDFIYQIVVIGEENQFLGVFIQVVNWEYVFVVVNEIDNVIVFVIFGGVYNINGFVQGDKY